jgi:hypothetical protein
VESVKPEARRSPPRRPPQRRARFRRLPDHRVRRRLGRALGRNTRGLLGDWMILAGAVVLFGSLFLTWSHQFSPALLSQFGSSPVLRGVPRDPTAWQVYSIADVLLALLAVALGVIAAAGSRTARRSVAGAGGIGLAFVLHATATPPTNGANIANPSLSPPAYFHNSPSAGTGATLAALGLVVALIGLGLSFTAD